MIANGKTITIDPEFAALCPPLSKEERSLLESNIEKDGCLEPLATWHNAILDGHNRHEICTRRGIHYATKSIDVKDRSEAINWIIAKQLGRRNLTDEQKSYLRGKRYLAERKAEGGDKRSIVAKSPDQSGHVIGTRERLAKEYGVGDGTIQRDATFAKAVDKLEPSDKAAVLSGTSGLTKTDVVAGKKPGDVTPTLRTAKRMQRAQEKAQNREAAAFAISQQAVSDIATPKQKKLIEFCEWIKRLAALVDSVISDQEAIAKAAKKEHWTPHAKTRVRGDLSAIKRDLSRLDQLLK